MARELAPLESEDRSKVVDYYSPTANMYGCEPCPKCKSKYRCVFNDRPWVIKCECGYEEGAIYKGESAL